MSIKLNDGTVLRNLEEQVQYLTNYHDVNQGLVQWGIRVVGQVETEDKLPLPYDGEYGDAIAVGTEAPFFFYIWTRAAIAGESPYWFPFGEISIVGPEGPVGPRGEKGDTGKSTKWYSGSSVPIFPSQEYIEGDMYLQTNGQVYRYQNNSWQPVVSIKGPQGVQGIQGPQGIPGPVGAPGPKGETGDVGGFINIWGILTNISQAPTPASLNNLTVAYLVGSAAPYDLYVQIGETSDTAVWTNTGPFNAATLVTVNGVGQNVWDADTKANVSELSKYIPIVRPAEKNLYYFPALSVNNDNSLSFWSIKGTPEPSGEKVVIRSKQGRAQIQDPVDVMDIANKKYVDSQKGTKLYHHELTGVSGTASTGETITSIILVSTISASITGGDENTLLMLYLSAVNSYIPYSGKITDIFGTSNAKEVKLQFHNRLNDGDVESITLNVRRMVDTVTPL